ncbi:uncharacterized protein LOC131155117 [Malania oleifera]|uniref:uncharacterized protein LOC131155117 n=1 Tax=Malania oleifera TaxID=397392 RepID=UPI0025AE8743|nr:uncharacterized protein LOC131155117 [Malania oleifera]
MANSVSVPVSLHSLASSVPIFNGTNFSNWNEQIQFHLGVLDLDLALRMDKPATITETSNSKQQALYKSWERSNRLSMMFMRMCKANNIKSTLPQLDNAKEYLKAVEDKFHSADKSLAGRLMAELTTMKFDGRKGMNEHVLEMSNLAARLNTLGMNTCTRPNISFTVGMLERYQSNPGMEHWKAAKKVLRYLKGTKHCMLTNRRTDQLEVVGYSDSNFAGCVDSRKSTYDYLFLLAGGAISWKSAKQTIIAASTMEAEFVASF